MKNVKKVTCLNHGGGHVVIAPTACAADGASLAATLGLKFEKSVRMRVAISDAKVPDPDSWKFVPVSAAVMSAWAGDIQLHLGSVVAAAMKAGGKAVRAEWNGFEINPKRIMKLIDAFYLYDSIKHKNVNIENLIGLQYTSSCSYSTLHELDNMFKLKVRRYAEIVDTRSGITLQFLKDYYRIQRSEKNSEKLDMLLKKTRKLSYEEAVYMVERELKVCRLVARNLLQADDHWSDYQYMAGKQVKVSDGLVDYKVIPYQPEFTKPDSASSTQKRHTSRPKA